MNAQTHIANGTLLIDFGAACARLNRWRGEMIENFARCEQAVTETIAALNMAGIEVQGAKYPHLVGQRYERLDRILSSPLVQSGHRNAALAAVRRFRNHDAVRAMLCHGVTKFAVDRKGEWVAVMTLMSFKAGAALTDKLALQEKEGRSLLARIVDERRGVSTALGQVRRDFTVAG